MDAGDGQIGMAVRKKRVFQVAQPRDDSACAYSVYSLEKMLTFMGIGPVRFGRSGWVRKLAYVLSKLHLVRKVVRLPKTAFFAQTHRMNEPILFPVTYLFEVIIYAFDCWPYRFDEWEAFFRRHRIKLAFLSAKRSAEEFGRRIPEMKTIWLPEACEPGEYLPDKPLKDRSVDVLELGRGYSKYHARILQPLKDVGKNHAYEKGRWQLIYKTQQQLAEGYGDAKISICFPASVTHPERAGDVETVTLRYFEGIASKCVIVGHCPAELIELFGYNPMIEADMENPGAQLLEILKDIESYQELVDRNYIRLLEVGTVEARAQTIAQKLVEHGYRL
jgi:hypothetical protein